MKLELLTNATVIDDAIRFVSSNNNKKSLSREEGNSKGSKEPYYNKDNESREGQQVKGELVAETTNTVF